MMERVVISCQSDIKDGMICISIGLRCNEPLTFPASLKRLYALGEYNWPFILPDGLEILELGRPWEHRAVKLPQSVKLLIRGSKYDGLPKRKEMIMFVGDYCWLGYVLERAYNSCNFYFPRLSVDGLNVKCFAYDVTIAMAGVCYKRGYGKDIARIFYRLIHSNMCAWNDYAVRFNHGGEGLNKLPI